jgi:hypothetical protein
LAQRQVREAVRSKEEGISKRFSPDARLVCLRELSRSSDRIFVGQVEGVSRKTIRPESEGKTFPLSVREITFFIQQVSKQPKHGPQIQVGALYKVTQSTILDTFEPISKGDEVLWYLSRDNSVGLASPLGLSGDFRVIRRGGDRFVVNMENNRGLFKPNLPVWEARWAREFRVSIGRLAKSDAQLKSWEKLAESPPSYGPIPLEIITSATSFLLEDGASTEASSKSSLSTHP